MNQQIQLKSTRTVGGHIRRNLKQTNNECQLLKGQILQYEVL